MSALRAVGLQVVAASVASVEDRGYALDIGVPDVRAFLAHSSMDTGKTR